ncbi:MAG: aminoglycoside phosphotransferase family protein [Herbinix sp.]|nr:aminoglycoside phosphotransferase family protein [Herbinix sp.]
MEEKDIRQICKRHQLQCKKITKVIGNFDKELFSIDDRYLIRTSKQPMLGEQHKLSRINDLKHVPHTIHASTQSIEGITIYYLILEYIQGTELFSEYNNLSDQDINDIGTSISDFLTDLHNIKGEKYDIGHYIPIIPGHDKSWRTGHELYWDYIYKGLKDIQLSSSLEQLLESSNVYIKTNISCLDYQNGPVLLHNDFHFKNIIVKNNSFSGVIDWECSQFGEMDFDLIHLLHWSLFPPTKDINTTKLFKIVFDQQMKNKDIPMVEKRLTIYMIEHDLMQIIWSKGNREEEFLSRLKWLLDGKLEEYLSIITSL